MRNCVTVPFCQPPTPDRPGPNRSHPGGHDGGLPVAFAPKAAYRGGESQDNLPAIDPHAVPLVGSPDALYVVTLLFDYKCPHCQQMHFMLDEVIRRYAGKLAFVLCPTPLNTNCNPYIPAERG